MNKLSYSSIKMNIKTNLLEEYVNFVAITRKQNKNLEIILFLFTRKIILFFFCFKQIHK